MVTRNCKVEWLRKYVHTRNPRTIHKWMLNHAWDFVRRYGLVPLNLSSTLPPIYGTTKRFPFSLIRVRILTYLTTPFHYFVIHHNLTLNYLVVHNRNTDKLEGRARRVSRHVLNAIELLCYPQQLNVKLCHCP